MTRTIGYVLAGLLAVGLGAGCMPSEPERAGGPEAGVPGDAPGFELPGPEELHARWEEHVEAAQTNLGNPEVKVIAAQLAMHGDGALDPLLDTLADPGSTPYAKLLAVGALDDVVGPEMAPRLIELAEESDNDTTRACAAQLLARIPGEDVLEALERLADDLEPRVRTAALLGLVSHGSEGARQRAIGTYHDLPADARERPAILHALLMSPEPGDIPILAAAAEDPNTGVIMRRQVVIALGQMGTTDEIPALQVAGELEPSIKELAEQAVAAIEERAATESGDDAEPGPARNGG